MKRSYTSLFLILTALLMMASVQISQAQRGQGYLTGVARSGDKIPVETITGVLERIDTGPCANTSGRAYIGTHLHVKNEETGQQYNIHLGSSQVLEDQVKELRIGNPLEIEAFRTSKMAENHYVAKSYTSDGHTVQLRDDQLRPVWAEGRNVRIKQDGFRNNRRSDSPRRGRW